MNNQYPINSEPEDKKLFSGLAQIQDILLETEMAECTRLAYEGKYKEAETKLIQLAKKNPNHAILDLLARVRIQQGDLIQAELLWRQALEYQPGCKECQNAIEEAHQLRALKIDPRKRNENRVRNTISWVVGILVVGLIIFLTFMVQGSSRNSTSQLATLNSSVSGIHSLVVALPTDHSDEVLAQIQTSNELIYGLATQVFLPTSTPFIPASLSDIPPAINLEDVKGITTRIEGNALIVTFNSALFKYETLLTDPGRETLTQVGNLLRPYSGEISVDVAGFVDISETSRTDLNLLRSATVITFLQDTIPMPQSDFRIISSEGMGAPFDNNSPDGRLKNRTVILIIRNQ